MPETTTHDLERFYERLRADGAIGRLLALARDEDLGEAGDVTSRACFGDASRPACAEVRAREAGVLAGWQVMPELARVFGFDGAVEGRVTDGDRFVAGDVIGTLSGPVTDLLAIERTVLNLLGRLSGVATLTSRYVDAVAGTGCEILDTRKTTPGWRALEKYAVVCGGGTSHRMGLHDAILIKDNHLALAGADLRSFLSGRLRVVDTSSLSFVEVEVDTLDQLSCVFDAVRDGARIDIVLLDNMGVADLTSAVSARDASGLDVRLEASGGVTLETVGAIAKTGVDRVSVGALTHQARSVDFGLDIQV